MRILIVLLILIAAGFGVYYFSQQPGEQFSLPIGEKEVTISGSISQDTIWRKGSVYLLEGLVFVEGGAKLTIDPGVVVKGKQGSALVVTRDGLISARGRANAPIVFTSAEPEGERKRGDWGGVVLLGNAPVNRGTAHIEGIADSDLRGRFGGDDSAHDCGTLEYVRIEFAGYEIGANNELNGLTLGGCGYETRIRYVQSHRGQDDGIEMFGGSADLRNIVVSGARDDSFDWDMGWNGRVQFLVIQQHGDVGDNGFEGDNWKSQPDATPRSAPQFFNVTMVGSQDIQQDQRAMTLRRGTGGVYRNFIITGFPLETIDLRGDGVQKLIDSGILEFGNSIIFDIGPNKNDYFSDESAKDDDAGFDEAAYFQDPARDFRFGVNPQLPVDAFNITAPNFTPAPGSPAADEGSSLPSGTRPGFWDFSAKYLGAIEPGATESWLAEWTAFPAN